MAPKPRGTSPTRRHTCSFYCRIPLFQYETTDAWEALCIIEQRAFTEPPGLLAIRKLHKETDSIVLIRDRVLPYDLLPSVIVVRLYPAIILAGHLAILHSPAVPQLLNIFSRSTLLHHASTWKRFESQNLLHSKMVSLLRTARSGTSRGNNHVPGRCAGRSHA